MGLLIRFPSKWKDCKEHLILFPDDLEIEILFSSAYLCNPPDFLTISVRRSTDEIVIKPGFMTAPIT